MDQNINPKIIKLLGGSTGKYLCYFEAGKDILQMT
jgi:tagatose-1,6-bisphosphate aldolase